MSWPDGGPWVVTATSSAEAWRVAVAALAAASSRPTAAGSSRRVAALRVIGPGNAHEASENLLRTTAATYLELYAGGAELQLDDVVVVTKALLRTHDLVLVGAVDGLLVPLGRRGWTLADLAQALPAPVVVVTDSGPEAANYTTLALDALVRRGVTGTVVVVDRGPAEPGTAGTSGGAGSVDGDDHRHVGLAALPVAPAGSIPAGAADRPERFAAEAPGWLDPLLHGTRGGAVTGAESRVPDTAAGSRTPVPGKRVVLALAVLFVVSLLVLCALNAMGPTATTLGGRELYLSQERVSPSYRTTPRSTPRHSTAANPRGLAPRVPPSAAPLERRAAPVCPQRVGIAMTGAPAAAITTARVNTAWDRLERWLAARAPTTAASLGPPAPAERIAAYQARMSIAFPPDLVASLRRHDGAATRDGFELPPFYRLLSLDQIVDQWRLNCGVLGEVAGLQDWWDRGFVPFAAARDGGCLLVDQRPGGHGRVGEFYPDDGTRFDRWPASVAELLEGVAGALETGQPYDGRYRPVVTPAGAMDWQLG